MSEIIQRMDTRRVFVETLMELTKKDDKIVLITCDVGFLYLEQFQERFPDRFFNFGVTEQSSAVICAAMALSGLKVYFYSMIPFVLFRPYEMVRNIIVKHNANVKIIGVQGGPAYKMLGFSHNLTHSEEDTNLCENIGLDSHIISDVESVRACILKTYQENKPVYIRL